MILQMNTHVFTTAPTAPTAPTSPTQHANANANANAHAIRDAALEELEFLWPQIVHILLMSKPHEGVAQRVALEQFVFKVCSSSLHIALLLHWHLRGYMSSSINLLPPSTLPVPSDMGLHTDFDIGASATELLSSSFAGNELTKKITN